MIRMPLLAACFLLFGCDRPADPLAVEKAEYRERLFVQCMSLVPPGPRVTHYNDWAEVIDACDSRAYYTMNQRYP